jgi:TetR/AcrR family transcriptional regulator, mexJK operon transcriptional repressor
MLETKKFKRGPGGRPTHAEAERRGGVLLETAARLFLERGIDGVSMDEITKQAGVAKRFIYSRYDGKSELFVAAVERWFADRLETLQVFELPQHGAEKGLLQFGRKLLELALQPDALALHRLLMMAAPRFPELAKLFVERNRHRITGEIVRVLAAYADRAEIESPHPQMLAEQFFIAIVGIPQRLALLGLRETPEQEQRRLLAAIRLFLDGCRTRQ